MLIYNIPKIMAILAQGTEQETKVTLPLSLEQIKSLYAKNGWELSEDFLVDPHSPANTYEDVNPLG